jgi:hypothetical protein
VEAMCTNRLPAGCGEVVFMCTAPPSTGAKACFKNIGNIIIPHLDVVFLDQELFRVFQASRNFDICLA